MGYPQPTHSNAPALHLLRCHSYRRPIDKRTRAAIGSVAPETRLRRALWNASICGRRSTRRARRRLETAISSARTIFAPGCFTSSRATRRRCIFIRTRKPSWWSKASVRSRISKAASGWSKRTTSCFSRAKEYYQLINKGTEPLVLFGNRSEPFGIGITRAEATK